MLIMEIKDHVDGLRWEDIHENATVFRFFFLAQCVSFFSRRGLLYDHLWRRNFGLWL